MLRPRDISITSATSVIAFAAKTPTLLPATHTNSYALGGREVLLVEPATPYEGEQRAWMAWVRGLASSGRVPIAIVATHHHPDHIGGVDVLSRELGLPIWAHAETAARIGDVPVARRLCDGDEITLAGPTDERWKVLHTPGHAWGHICLFEQNSGAIVVGDMVASVGTILIAQGDGDMRIYLQQLERLAALKTRTALPAHGDPIDHPSGLFRKYVAHRLAREAKVLSALVAVGPGGATVLELVVDAYNDTPIHIWPIAALSLAAHLEKLVYEGRAHDREGRFVAV